MKRNNIKSAILSLAALGIALVVALVPSTPSQAQGSWPPFVFAVTPVYEDGQITYNLFFLSYLEGDGLVDLDIRIPLPEGTRYVEGNAQASTEVSFDGEEVRFFTAALRAGAIPTASFVAEVIDPAQEMYVTQPWLSWKGQQPGEYQAAPVEVDVTKPDDDWSKWPFPKRMLLEAAATVSDDVLTYYIFPLNYSGRMWDVTVSLPLPDGATFISAEPSGPFTATFDGREVSFKAVELPQREQHSLQVKVSTQGVTSPALVTHAWAQWRNVGFGVGRVQPPKTDTRTGDIIVQPHATGWVMADGFDDVPFGYYDVSSLAAQDKGDAFDVIFYTRDPLDPAGQPLLFVLYINTTCQAERQYRLIYSHRTNRAVLQSWNAATASWGEGQRVEGSQAGPRMVVIQISKTLLNQAESFCGVGRVVNTSRDYSAPLEIEAVPDRTDADVIAAYSVYGTISFEEGIGYYRAIAINLEQLETVLPTLVPEQQTSLNPDKVETAINYLSGFSLDEIGPFSRDALNLRDKVEERLAQLEERVARLEELVIARGLRRVEERLDERFEDRPEGRIARLEERVTHLEELITARVLAAAEERLEDRVGRLEARVTQLEQGLKAGLEARLETGSGSPETQPGAVPSPAAATAADLGGKLAIPLDHGQGYYDLHVFAVPTGQEIVRIPDAHQPDFNYDGQRLLFNREGYGVNFIYEYDLATNTEKPVTDNSNNDYPVYDLWGNRVAYGNVGLALGQPVWAQTENGEFDLRERKISLEDALKMLDDLDALPPEMPGVDLPILPSEPIFLPPNTPPRLVERIRERLRDRVRDRILDAEISIDLPYQVSLYRPFLYVQCSLSPSQQEGDERCRDVAGHGMLYPDQMGEIQGRNPVWTANDMIVYNGCNTWAGSRLCGIFTVPAASTRRAGDGIIPARLTDQPSDLPADSKGGLITFTSRRDGDWEAYVMNLDGSQVRNLSQSPASNDGLPAISPDGQWVAFVSDRSGRWAVWVVPTAGGEAMRLFDLPAENPWAGGDRAWFYERLAWGGEAGDGPLPWEPASVPDYLALYPTPIRE